MYFSISSTIFLLLGLLGYIIRSPILMELIITTSFLFLFFESYNKSKKINLLFLFLISFFTFNLSRLYLGFFDGFDWTKGEMFIKYQFDINTQLNILLTIHLFISFISLGLMFINNNSKLIIDYENDKTLEDITVYLMLISFLPLVFRKYIEIKLMSGMAYSDIYINGGLSIPYYLKGWNFIFEYSFYAFLISRPNKKKYIFFSVLFVFINILEAINGGRTQLITNIFLIITFYSYFYSLRINYKIIFMAISLVIFSQTISYLRSYQNLPFNIFDSIGDFFYEQGGSLSIIGLNDIYSDRYLTSGLYNIISPFHDGIMSLIYPIQWAKQDVFLAHNSFSLPVQLSYAINESYFLKGFGVGGNMLSEVYNFSGYIGVCIFGFMFGVLLINFDRFRYSKFMLFMMIPFILNLYISPRASFLPNISLIINFLVVFFILISIKNISILLFYHLNKKQVNEN